MARRRGNTDEQMLAALQLAEGVTAVAGLPCRTDPRWLLDRESYPNARPPPRSLSHRAAALAAEAKWLIENWLRRPPGQQAR